MTRGRRLAGVGGIAFVACFMVGFTLFGPKGGHYSSVEVDRFLAQSSGARVASICLVAVSSLGLIALMAYLSESSFGARRRSRVTWAAGVLAAASVLVGWSLYLAPGSSTSSGGPAIDPGSTYAFLSAGMGIIFGVGGIMLGLALVTLAVAGHAISTWLRAFTGLAGLSAFSTWPFLVALNWSPNQWLPGPFYLVILWGLVMGTWLLVTSSAAAETDA
jgi:hypothetical protein